MQANAITTAAPRSLKPATVLIASAVLALIAVAAIAIAQTEKTSPAITALGPDGAGSTVAIEVGGELTITLPANPSTGYSWVVSSNSPAFLTEIGEPEFSVESDLIGAGGAMTFRFAGTTTGQGDLQLDYLRPWEEAAPLETYLVTVNVR